MADTPAPRECKFCGHTYHKPCDGEDPKCGNRPWAEEQKALTKAEGEQK